jgi:hypothetical protein
MTDTNGKKTMSDMTHRIGIWAAVIGLSMYVFNMGAWVGAADEKFNDAATVEATQQALLLQVNTVAVTQDAQSKAIEENKEAIEKARLEILAAIAAADR